MPKKSMNKKTGKRPVSAPQPIARKQRAQRSAQKQKSRSGKSTSISQDIGNLIGKGIGWLGDKAVNAFENAVGFGDYEIESNSLIDGNSPPMFNNNQRATIIRHREYIGDVYSSTNFTIQYALPINPGLSASFPWLSQVAANFEEYKIHGAVYQFKSASATAVASNNTALGVVVMATEYDVLKPAFTSKIAMENYHFSTSSKPCESALHPVECDPKETPITTMFTRTDGSPANDKRFTDHGIFYVATVGQQLANVNLGELWLTYEIELIKPRLSAGQAAITEERWLGSGYTASGPAGNGVFGPLPYTLVSPSKIPGVLTFVGGNSLNISGLSRYVGTEIMVDITALSNANWSGTIGAPVVSGGLSAPTLDSPVYPSTWTEGSVTSTLYYQTRFVPSSDNVIISFPSSNVASNALVKALEVFIILLN